MWVQKIFFLTESKEKEEKIYKPWQAEKHRHRPHMLVHDSGIYQP